jgi:hypothetical protein
MKPINFVGAGASIPFTLPAANSGGSIEPNRTSGVSYNWLKVSANLVQRFGR